jgi:hypothetical protein
MPPPDTVLVIKIVLSQTVKLILALCRDIGDRDDGIIAAKPLALEHAGHAIT